MKALLNVNEAAAEIGSRTKVYELIGSGKLKAVKLGARTKIDSASLVEFIASLPPARIAPPRRRAVR